MGAFSVHSAEANANSLGAVGQATGTDWWPMFRHDLDHSGYSTTTGPSPRTTPPELWYFLTDYGIEESSPSVANGIVYIGGGYGHVYAINATTGKQVWSNLTTSGSFIYSSPAVVNGVVYIGSNDGRLYAFNAANGAKLWNYTTGSAVQSSPAVTNGVVYFGSYDDHIYALNASTGKQLWNYTTGGWVFSSPAVDGGVVYVGSYDDHIYALNATDGKKLWDYTTGNIVSSSPAVVDGTVYVGSWDDNVYALNASTGAKEWNYTTGSTVRSSPAVTDGVVYFGCDDDHIYALNAATSKQLWNYSTGIGSDIVGSAAVVGGVVYVGTFGALTSLYAINATTGTKLWIDNRGYSIYDSPAVCDGVVYLADGPEVYALAPRPLSVSISPTAVTMNVSMSQQFNSTVSNGTPPYFLQWYLNGTAVSGATGFKWTFTPTSSGSYKVYLNVTDSAGVIATSPSCNVTVNATVPEFQPYMLLPLFLIITLLGAIILKKKRDTRASSG